MGWEVFLLKTPTNRERDLGEVQEAVAFPCWQELWALLEREFPDLRSGAATLDRCISFPVLARPGQYALEFNLGVDSEEEPIQGVMFSRPDFGARWAYPLKFLCELLDARIPWASNRLDT